MSALIFAACLLTAIAVFAFGSVNDFGLRLSVVFSTASLMLCALACFARRFDRRYFSRTNFWAPSRRTELHHVPLVPRLALVPVTVHSNQ
ncbi:hypothetical protein [Planctomicrobium piriforme]|uniref:Uncharacterized protein n=1 Tax=Planctomicrobium piriforme TaxID=1576369 RepID=A0A1I3PWE0_9PLAN|nr:hypothetical protein [Planctomicrobium piriforme]SFJ25246.1 hypothetical protein SAMN05421753_11745 [Planctomicrobium piriforme]